MWVAELPGLRLRRVVWASIILGCFVSFFVLSFFDLVVEIGGGVKDLLICGELFNAYGWTAGSASAAYESIVC